MFDSFVCGTAISFRRRKFSDVQLLQPKLHAPNGSLEPIQNCFYLIYLYHGGIPMILAGDFRKGVTVEIDGQVWSIADFQHVKPGKGAAFVRTRLKNVMTGAVLERTFSPTDKYPTAHIETREMQYLYTDGDLYYFMDNESYEQLALNHEQVEDAIDFVVENSNVTIRFYKGNAFSVAAPNFVELTVTETEPGFKGDTATGTTKPAVLETGYKIAVPLFVNEGDRIRVDTRTGEYMERC